MLFENKPTIALTGATGFLGSHLMASLFSKGYNIIVFGRSRNLVSSGAVDEELLDLMKLAGFNEVDIGAKSTCYSILENLAKDFKREDIINTANLLKKKKIHLTWFIMLGALAETSETVLETMNTIGRVASK